MHISELMGTQAGRHLVFAYGTVFEVQGGYVGWMVWNWWKLNKAGEA
jgi:hypothetical protein